MAAISQTPASVVLVSGTPATGTYGATVTAGMPIYRDAADSNQLKPCRANAAGTANCDGIALNNGADGQPGHYLPTGSVINLGATLVVGQTYSVSDAVAGEIVPNSDLGTTDFVTNLGVALTAANLMLSIVNSATAKP
jgi:hypothetical protein